MKQDHHLDTTGEGREGIHKITRMYDHDDLDYLHTPKPSQIGVRVLGLDNSTLRVRLLLKRKATEARSLVANS